MRWSTSWWAQAIQLGMVAGGCIWMTSTAILLSVSLLAAWGPATFLRAVLYLFIPLLACTAPVWVIGGLLALVSLGSRETRVRRAANTENGAAENSGLSIGDAGWRRRTFPQGWSRRLHSFEQGIVDWFVLRPALLEQRVDTAGRGNSYLHRYRKGWLLGSLSLFVVLIVIGLGARAKVAPGDTPLHGYLVAVTLLEFVLGGCLCSLLIARYVVTRVVLKRVGDVAEGANRHVGN